LPTTGRRRRTIGGRPACGVFVRIRLDGKNYAKHAQGPGHVLDKFNNSLGSHSAIAAQ
jgi:hypothetical protein